MFIVLRRLSVLLVPDISHLQMPDVSRCEKACILYVRRRACQVVFDVFIEVVCVRGFGFEFHCIAICSETVLSHHTASRYLFSWWMMIILGMRIRASRPPTTANEQPKLYISDAHYHAPLLYIFGII